MDNLKEDQNNDEATTSSMKGEDLDTINNVINEESDCNANDNNENLAIELKVPENQDTVHFYGNCWPIFS